MYITVNDIIGEKRINLSYPIHNFDPKDVAVVSMISDNIQYWLKEPVKLVIHKTGEEKLLSKGVYNRKGTRCIDRIGEIEVETL